MTVYINFAATVGSNHGFQPIGAYRNYFIVCVSLLFSLSWGAHYLWKEIEDSWWVIKIRDPLMRR